MISLTMFNFSINILTILILSKIISFMFILAIINFFIVGFSMKYLFISLFKHINFISG